MDMEGVRSSIIAALLFLTLVVLAVAASGGGGDDAAVVEEEQGHPLADEPYLLVTFKNKDGEEIRLVADKWSETLSSSGFANRSGNWFYAIREGKRRRQRRLRLPLPHQSRGGSRTAEGLWNTLGALANTATASGGDPAAAGDDDDDERYVLVGMETSGGHKMRFVAVADQRYVAVTGYAHGFSNRPRWSFRDGERHRLVPTLGNAGSHHGGSHAEFVASNLLAALMKAASS